MKCRACIFIVILLALHTGCSHVNFKKQTNDSQNAGKASFNKRNSAS